MKNNNKLYLVFLFLISFTSFGFQQCEYNEEECECEKPIRIEFAEVIETAQVHNNILNYLSIPYDTTVLYGYYEGFNLGYSITLLDSVWEDSAQIALNGDYCDCFSDIFQFAKSYPTSIKVFAKYQLNDTIPQNANVTDYMVVSAYSPIQLKRNQNKIEIDSSFLLQQYFRKDSPLAFRFSLENIYLKNDSAQFIIETTLNTKKILTTQTPLIKFK